MKRLILFAPRIRRVRRSGTQATAATPTSAQFNALKKQVTTLEEAGDEAPEGSKDTDDLAIGVLGYGICSAANTADALQGTWQAVDQREQAQGRQPVFGASAQTGTPVRAVSALLARTRCRRPSQRLRR